MRPRRETAVCTTPTTFSCSAPAPAPPPSPPSGPAFDPGAPTSSPTPTCRPDAPPCASPPPIPTASSTGSAPIRPDPGCIPAASKIDPGSSNASPAAAPSGATTVPPSSWPATPPLSAPPSAPPAFRRPPSTPSSRRPPAGRWLVKPTWGLGDSIHFWTPADAADRPSLLVHVQEFLEGEAQAAVFCGDGKRAALLGVSRQLVGLDWLHAAPFRYCGSVGPAPAGRRPPTQPRNPRRRPRPPMPAPRPVRRGRRRPRRRLLAGRGQPALHRLRRNPGIRRRILGNRLAPRRLRPDHSPSGAPLRRPDGVRRQGRPVRAGDLAFPDDGPWNAVLRSPAPLSEPPAFADIPHPGTHIKAGRPVFTFFVRGKTADDCIACLRRTAAELDRLLFPS